MFLTEKQQKYKANRIKGMNQYNAARAAGYSENVASKQTLRMEKVVKSSILDALEQAGLTDKYQSEELYKLTQSDDALIRLNTWKHIADLKGMIKVRNEHTGKDGAVLPTPIVNVYVAKNTTDQCLRPSESIASSRGEGLSV